MSELTSGFMLPDRESRNSNFTIGVLSVAIGERYVTYWRDLLESVDEMSNASGALQMHVFTDQPELVKKLSNQYPRTSVLIHEAETMGWPDATLRRYEIFEKAIHDLNEPILMYLDADMLIARPLPISFLEQIGDEEVFLVEHPGFYRGKTRLRRIINTLMYPRSLIYDVKLRLKFGGLGTWETRQESTAYVPRSKRKKYVCGGCWFGGREGISKLIKELARATNEDTVRGIVAKWHDESHLNAYLARRAPSTVTPEWCFSEGSTHLQDLRPLIIAVDKGQNFER